MNAYLLPHPPLIVPGVGAGDEIPDTRAAFGRVAAEITELAPETVIYVTPHSCMYGDYIHISPGAGAVGDFGQFRARGIKLSVEYDEELATLIGQISSTDGLPAGPLGERDASLDHGVLVPLYFLQRQNGHDKSDRPLLPTAKIVRISLSGFPLIDHYRFGMYVADAVRRLGRRAVLIASGDMSHRLKEDGPYGFAPEGPAHDEYVKSCLENSDMRGLLAIDPSVSEGAGECGLASIAVAAGYLDGHKVRSEVYSYEGPYGVGYLVAALSGQQGAPSLLPELVSDRDMAIAKARETEDPYVRLARANVEYYVKNGSALRPENDDLSPEMLTESAGVFVSIKKDGALRGCIGTIAPTRKNIAEEILSNSVSAAARDPRFDPIDEGELDSLTYSVDVLAAPEPIDGPNELDVKRYGVIVSSRGRRGLLLPDLDGVDTPEQQIDIARRKGGIGEHEPYTLERFEVIRHR
ncbi:MAG: AmmeMemoRadiSam system protein A [Clostridiales Family XIII bacterium]|nr:AmmeMemoRadiSam system protein A [Clostridiales Family XIII bacterium]